MVRSELDDRTKDSPIFSQIGGMHLIYVYAKGLPVLKKGGAFPYPDGTVFADDAHEFSVKDGSYVEGSKKAVTVMVKDATKYATTGGWGFHVWAGGDPSKPLIPDAAQDYTNCQTKKRFMSTEQVPVTMRRPSREQTRNSKWSSSPFPTSIARRSFTKNSDGGATPTSASITAFASSSSRRRAPAAQFGTSITSAAPGSARGLHLIVSDIHAARDELAGRGVQISEVLHSATTANTKSAPGNAMRTGPTDTPNT